MKIRQHGFPTGMQEPVWCFADDTALKAHKEFQRAKAGNIPSAIKLVEDLALPFLLQVKNLLPSNACYVSPHAKEATGDNAIPQVLAQAAAIISGGEIDTDIVQISRVFHTGADPMERMATRAEFEGLVTPGKNHILVDDVTTMGGTLAELADYIQNQNGLICGVLVLVNAGRSKELRPSSKISNQIKHRNELKIEEILQISPHALTANEANYLIGFRTADEIRNRLAKARKETNRRLLSKGIDAQN
jgi:hypothetical protein